MMDTTRQRLIGLTGGIATGKTTVSNYLATAYQLPVLDADVYAKEAVDVGSPALNAIARRYGDEILLPNGTLNRQLLGEIVFNNSDERCWLEQLIHPEVRDRFIEAIQQSSASMVLVIPLLFESSMTDLVTEIWVVYCSEQQQIERLMQRSKLTRQAAQARIDSQMPIVQKCEQADVVLDNSSTLEALLKQVDSNLPDHA